ncbi:MAG: DNA polymerase IV [Syntrophomonadaceae bacterium]|jgi:DNA polymerase-4|nr:DNA polymerase IV [Syntrophomonadaceae bacterium]
MNILHCDLDAFFASVEQRDHPELKGKPVIIGALPGSRGVVSTCSYEARFYGVRSAMPINQAYRLCPQGVFILPDLHKYQGVSQQVFAILQRYSPIIEPLSIDEAFLDVSACHLLFGGSTQIASMIKQDVSKELGLSISVGIAANKFLAKLATNLSKPDGLLEMGEQQVRDVLPALPVTEIWGIGSKTAARLERAGITSVSDLLASPRSSLVGILGSNTDLYIQLCKGQDTRPVETKSQRQSLGNEITFPQDLADPEKIQQVLLELSCQVGYRMRQCSLMAHTITIKMRTPEFRTFTRSQTLLQGVDSDLGIYDIVLGLYQNSGLPGSYLRLLGVSASKLIDSNMEPNSLFVDKSKTLDAIMDNMKNKFGQETIKRGSLIDSKQDYRPDKE